MNTKTANNTTRRLVSLAADAGFFRSWDARDILESLAADAVSVDQVLYRLSQEWKKHLVSPYGNHKETSATRQAERDFVNLFPRVLPCDRDAVMKKDGTKNAEGELALITIAEGRVFNQFDYQR